MCYRMWPPQESLRFMLNLEWASQSLSFWPCWDGLKATQTLSLFWYKKTWNFSTISFELAMKPTYQLLQQTFFESCPTGEFACNWFLTTSLTSNSVRMGRCWWALPAPPSNMDKLWSSRSRVKSLRKLVRSMGREHVYRHSRSAMWASTGGMRCRHRDSSWIWMPLQSWTRCYSHSRAPPRSRRTESREPWMNPWKRSGRMGLGCRRIWKGQGCLTVDGSQWISSNFWSQASNQS